MKKNQIIPHIRIEKIWYEWVWLASLPDGKKLIVKWGVLPGMVCDLRVVRNRKDYAECHVVDIVSVDKEYATGEIKCPHYLYAKNDMPVHKSGCGGCKWQIVAYGQQLTIKHDIVVDSFRHLGKAIEVLPVLASPEIWWYRNKIEYSFGKFISWKLEDKQTLSDWSLGFHRQGMFGKIIDIDQCFLVDEKVNKIFKYIKALLEKSWLPVYDQMRHEGVLRHLLMRQAKRNNQIMVVLSVSGELISREWTNNSLIRMLQEDSWLKERITTFVLIVNDSLADVVATRDSKFETLWGDGIINETLKIKDQTLNFDISPLSFFQTNSTGAELLYSTAINMVGDVQWTILDLYCGTGTIGIAFVKALQDSKGTGNGGVSLIGVEEIESAVADAYKNAEVNRLKVDYHFFAGKVEKLLQMKDGALDIKSWDSELAIPASDLGLVIVDPPRSGLHEGAVQTLIELKKQTPHLRVCYISCNPVTLARDLRLLSEVYTFDTVQPVDMFPHTYHIENIVVLR